MFSAPMLDYLMGISSCNRYDGKTDDKSGFTANYINGVGATAESTKKSLEDCKVLLHQFIDHYFQSLGEDVTFVSTVMSYKGDPKMLLDLITDHLTKRDAFLREKNSTFGHSAFDLWRDFLESMVRKSFGSDYASYYAKHGLGAFSWKPDSGCCSSSDCSSNEHKHKADNTATATSVHNSDIVHETESNASKKKQ